MQAESGSVADASGGELLEDEAPLARVLRLELGRVGIETADAPNHVGHHHGGCDGTEEDQRT